MDNWPSIAHLYAFPPSDRLTNALADGSVDRVFTTPVLRHTQLLDDKMLEAATTLIGRTVNRPNVSNDKNGLKTLIKQGHLKTAFNLTTNILKEMGHVSNAAIRRTVCTVESFEIWNCRFQLLMALQMHKVLLDEMSAFNELDAPDLYFENRSNYRRLNFTGSVIPFQIRLIHAEIVLFSDVPGNALGRLAKLTDATKNVLESMKGTEHEQIWSDRLHSVELTKARVLYRLKEQKSALKIYSNLLDSTTDVHQKQELQNLTARISMVLGSTKLLDKHGEDVFTDKAMKAIFSGNYQKALDCLLNQVSEDVDSAQSLNNQAICYLYMGRVKEAVDILLSAKDPNTPLMLNLYTIGELVSVDAPDLRATHFSKHVENLPDTFDPYLLRVLK